MKIPKLFKKAAAFVMAAVTALSIMPATAFAAGDIGTISFSHTYDSNGNAMRYNSSANIGGYTAGGTGNYKYRMFVDGENAFCIQPGVPLKTGNTLKKASSDTWNALSANQKKAVGLALLYGYQGNRNNLSGSDDEKWLATQTLVWEFVTGCREATGSYNQTSTTVYSLHFGSNYANSGVRAVYDQIVAMLREHNTIPSFMSGGKNDITKELAYKDGKYSITLTDSNGVLSDYSFSSSDSNVSVSKSDFIVFYRIIWILEVVWMKYKILVVDDDKELVKMLCSYFNMKQYETITATDGMEALNKIKMKPDIILLDINMPRMDGIEVCRLIRSKVLCPILFLTARVDEDDKINGLLSGGDDYITKPFSLRELEARIVTNIKREERHQQKTEYRFMDEMLMDYSEKIVAIAGHRIEFTKIEYQIIEFLSMHPGQVFDKERIYAQVCGYDAEGDSRTITELVRRIRKKIADYSEKEYIETVWGIGYRWKK